jgi:UDP-N-acetylglucosamine transferase subunit ALG13
MAIVEENTMILVTVGTEQYPFNRLMEWIDSLIKLSIISPEEKVIVQYGSCTHLPKNVEAYPILQPTEFQDLAQKARLIIAHCGEGTIDLLATLKVPFILVPRSHIFGEHVDNHQLELAAALRLKGICIAQSKQELAYFVSEPKLTSLEKAPTDYYHDICDSLSQRFQDRALLFLLLCDQFNLL